MLGNFEKVCKVMDKSYNELKGRKMGKLPTYIPGLASGNAETFGISFTTIDGKQYSVGSSKAKVTIQSVSKLLTLAYAIDQRGVATINKKVGLEGNPFPFNSLTAAVITPTKTISPFTNQGAITTTSLLYKSDPPSFANRINSKIGEFVGSEVGVNNKIANSDMYGNTKNRALAWIMASYGKLEAPVDKLLDVYTKQCAIEVDSNGISIAGATLANNGINPITKKRVVSKKAAVYTLRYLASVSFPNQDFKWDLSVGSVPAKSGVGGGIVVIIHGVGALGLVAPPLMEDGMSAKGYAAAVPITRAILKTYVPNRHPGYSGSTKTIKRRKSSPSNKKRRRSLNRKS